MQVCTYANVLAYWHAMKVIAVLAQKGGVGKSMLTRSLAVQALIDGRKAAIIDADPQGSTRKWGKRRQSSAPAILAGDEAPVADLLADLKGRGCDLAVIDTPPHSQPSINAAAEIADLCLVVTEPYPDDLAEVAPPVAIARRLGKATGIVLNKTPSRAHALTLARNALATFDVPVCPTALTHFLAHPYASGEGLTAQEREPGSKATAELAALWQWLMQQWSL
jgi:chromosome partitioning protein